MNNKILVIVNDYTTIVNFRKEVLASLVDSGYEVIVSIPYHERVVEIQQLGCEIIYNDKLTRHGTNPIKDLKLYFYYKKLLKKVKPNVVLNYTIKPNVYGGLACRKLKIPYVANITGLSNVVENKGILQAVTLFLYKIGLKKANCIFFQNNANLEFFASKKIKGKKTQLLPGSGVNLEKYQFEKYPSEEDGIKIAFVGRFLKDKGVNELAWCAKQLLSEKQLKFIAVGDVENNEENPFTNIENVQCVGYQKDVREYLKQSSALVLPSYHEGLANVLLEACATGRPVLASNIPGCKETFDEGVTGFGFNAKDKEDLLKAIKHFISLPIEKRREMGKKAREKIQNQFNRDIVISMYKKEIASILK